MSEILEMVSTYGFPMVIAIYLLVRMEPLIKGLQKSIDTLTLVVSLQNNLNTNDLEEIQDKLKDKYNSN